MNRSRKRKTPIADDAFQKEAERLLITLRKIRQSLSDQDDPDERRRTRRLLRSALRNFATYRRGLEALRDHPYIGPALEQQIQVIMLLEDECRVDSLGTRPV